MKRPPTLQDLAKQLGLSVATVSLALRGMGNLSDATRERVRRAAKKIGYRPNTYATALSSRQHPSLKHNIPLAVLRRQPVPDAEWYPVNPFMEGICSRAAELGYRVEVFAHNPGMSLENFLRMLFNRGFQGIFLAPVGEFAPPLSEWDHFSVVSCGRFDTPSPFHTVRHEIFESTLGIIVRLRDMGCKRIGLSLFRHDPPIIDDKQRIAAALFARTALRIKAHHFFYRTPQEMVASVRKEGFDGVAAFSIAEYFYLKSEGFQIPGEVRVVAQHLYDEQWNHLVPGLLATEFDCGVASASRMDSMIRHRERGIPKMPEHIVVQPRWCDAMEAGGG